MRFNAVLLSLFAIIILLLSMGCDDHYVIQQGLEWKALAGGGSLTILVISKIFVKDNNCITRKKRLELSNILDSSREVDLKNIPCEDRRLIVLKTKWPECFPEFDELESDLPLEDISALQKECHKLLHVDELGRIREDKGFEPRLEKLRLLLSKNLKEQQ